MGRIDILWDHKTAQICTQCKIKTENKLCSFALALVILRHTEKKIHYIHWLGALLYSLVVLLLLRPLECEYSHVQLLGHYINSTSHKIDLQL